MMFAFPKQQQKSCCLFAAMLLLVELALFPCTMIFGCQPLCALKKGCLCICAASRPSRYLCDDEKVRTRHLACFFCSLLTLGASCAGATNSPYTSPRSLQLPRSWLCSAKIFCWYLLMLGCRASMPFALSSNFRGAFFFIALE